MEYVNLETGVRINLNGLTPDEKKFYNSALKKFQANARGGIRQGAGRPPTGQTVRKTVSWRLPIHLLTRAYKNAAMEGITVTAWVEHALRDALKRKPRKRRQAA